MKWVGLTYVATSAVWIGLLAGCSPQRDAQPRALTAESRLRVGEAAEASGDRQTALAMYAAAANDAPNDTQTQLRSAEGLARNGSLEDAAALLTRRLKTAPHDIELLRTLGAIQVMAGQPARAVQTLSDVLAIRPDDEKALVNKAVALDILHKHDQAQDLYRKALALSPDDITISNDLALSLLLSGHREEARVTMLPLRSASNLPERIKTNLGILDAATGHSVEARQMLGARIGPSDLSSLTQAISMQGAGFQPDAGTRIVSRGVLTETIPPRVEPAVVLVEPVAAAPDRVARRAEPVVIHRPLQEQRADPAAARDAPAVPRAVSPSPPVADAKPIPRPAIPDVSPMSQPTAAKVESGVQPGAGAGAAVESRGPVQDDLVPHNVRAPRAEATTVSLSPAQEPLAAPAATPAPTAAPVVLDRRPLQERVTLVPQPAIQPDTPTELHRPLQEQPASGVATAIAAPR